MKTLKGKLAITAALLAAVVALTTAGTLAVFTDQDAVAANSFSTGSIALTTNPTTAVVAYSAMMPGDVVTNPLVVTNAGTAELRYAMKSEATNTDSKGLKDKLVLAVSTIDATTPETPCSEFDGAPLYTGDLDSAAGLILGSAVPGEHAGDRVLAVGSETLCFRVSLPSATGNAAQAAATTATFTFDSEQTKNN